MSLDVYQAAVVQLLLDAPVAAAQQRNDFDLAQYQVTFKKLYDQELPYFERKGLCGHCGSKDDKADGDWLDFLSYIQFKALFKQVPVPAWCVACIEL